MALTASNGHNLVQTGDPLGFEPVLGRSVAQLPGFVAAPGCYAAAGTKGEAVIGARGDRGRAPANEHGPVDIFAARSVA